MEWFSHFEVESLILFVSALTLLLSSIFLFEDKRKISLAFIFLGTFVLGIFISSLDPFLVIWDEQFHAHVAKNLIDDLLRPKLYNNPILAYQKYDWTTNHIWLHKQPLFLWQMALSMGMFGINILAMRLPSVVMHALLPIMIYRIGNISVSPKTGFIAAVFTAVAFYPLELVAGRLSTDHNDVAFMFYVLASFWSWVEYNHSRRNHWLCLIGIFCGFAILTKWLMGLLIFFIWGSTILYQWIHEKKLEVKELKKMFVSLTICAIVFLPWQLYIHSEYPLIAKHELDHISAHFTESIENHGEHGLYHFTDAFSDIYGSGTLVPLFYLLGLIFLIKRIKLVEYRIMVIVAVSFVYLFYSLATTKMTSFTIIVSPFFFLGIAAMLSTVENFLIERIKINSINKILRLTLPTVVALLLLNPRQIAKNHTDWRPHNNFKRNENIKEYNLIMSLKEKYPSNSIFFNTTLTAKGHIPFMFHTDFTAYDFLPSPGQIETLKRLNYSIKVLNIGTIPNYIQNDPRIELVEVKF